MFSTIWCLSLRRPFCAVSLYTLRFWLLNAGPGEPCDGSVSGEQRVALHSLVSWVSSPGLCSLALGSPLTSCLWFCLSSHSLLLAGTMEFIEVKAQGLLCSSKHLSFPTPGGGFVVCQLHKHSQTPWFLRGNFIPGFSPPVVSEVILWPFDFLISSDNIFNNTCHFPALEGFLIR